MILAWLNGVHAATGVVGCSPELSFVGLLDRENDCANQRVEQ